MAVRIGIVVLLAVVGGVVLLQSRDGDPAASRGSSAVDRARSCLAASPGFQVRESPDAKGVKQLFVTTPSGSSSRSGNVTVRHEAGVFLTFFESPAQADRWSDALEDIAAATGGADAQNEMIGLVFADWSVMAPKSERQTVRDCVGG